MVNQLKVASAGLCTTCTHAPGCALRKDSKASIFDCEEFSGNGSSARGHRKSSAPVRGRRRAVTGVGLCATCEARKTCTSADSEGGVWHCEEYR